MIVFDLKCANDHVFEAWFGSSSAYEEQRTRGLVSCPICGDAQVAKAVMAPNVGSKGNSREFPAAPMSSAPMSSAPVSSVPVSPRPAKPDAPMTPEAMKAVLNALATAQTKALEKSEWVGSAFADRARAMHAGEEAVAPIHGQSTRAEARALIEEGVPIAPLIVPVVPPKALN